MWPRQSEMHELLVMLGEDEIGVVHADVTGPDSQRAAV
jgi:hypothetical protein